MTAPLPFTENAIRRAVEGARKAGVRVSAVAIGPNGTITIYDALDAKLQSEQHQSASKWADAFGTKS